MPAGQQAADSWWRRARCMGRPELFFPPAGPEQAKARLERERAAIALCAQCPIRIRCLDYALRHDIRDGIWGGRTEHERAEPRIAGAHRPHRAGSDP